MLGFIPVNGSGCIKFGNTEMKRILVLQTAFPGDAILTLPLIQKIYEKYGEPEIDVICIPASADIFTASPKVNSVLILDKKNTEKSLFSLLSFSKKIRENKYDILFSPHRSFRSGIISFLSYIPERISFDNASIKEAYTKVVKYRKDFHEVQRNLSLLNTEALSDFPEILPEIVANRECKAKIQDILGKIKSEEIVIIAPGSVWETKKYPEEYFKTITGYLINKSKTVIAVGSLSDKELCSRLSEDKKKYFNLAGELTIPETVELMRHVNLVICNDSSPAHMAVSANQKVLTIYCSTIKDFGFYPYTSKSSIISYNEIDCKPCGIHGHKKCPLGHFNCGKLLLPEKVLEKIEEILAY